MSIDMALNVLLLALVAFYGWYISRYLRSIAAGSRDKDEALKAAQDKLASVVAEKNYRLGLDQARQAYGIRQHEIDLERKESFLAGQAGEYERGVVAEYARSRPAPLIEDDPRFDASKLDFHSTLDEPHDDAKG